MHSSLSPHLHTPECNELIALLENCHKEHYFRKFMGYCNEQNTRVLQCMKQEVPETVFDTL